MQSKRKIIGSGIRNLHSRRHINRKHSVFHKMLGIILCLLLIVIIIFQLILYETMFTNMKRSIRDSSQHVLQSTISLAEITFSTLTEQLSNLAENPVVVKTVLLPDADNSPRNFSLITLLNNFSDSSSYIENITVISRFDNMAYSTDSLIQPLEEKKDIADDSIRKIGNITNDKFSLIRTAEGKLCLQYEFLDRYSGNLGTILAYLDEEKLFSDICVDNDKLFILSEDMSIVYAVIPDMIPDIPAGQIMDEGEYTDNNHNIILLQSSDLLELKFCCWYPKVVLPFGSFLFEGSTLAQLLVFIPVLTIAALFISWLFYRPIRKIIQALGDDYQRESDENEWIFLQNTYAVLNDKNRNYSTMIGKVGPYIFEKLLADLLSGEELEDTYISHTLTGIKSPFHPKGFFTLFVTSDVVTGVFDPLDEEQVLQAMAKMKYKDCVTYSFEYRHSILTLVQLGAQTARMEDTITDELKRIISVYTDDLKDTKTEGGYLFSDLSKIRTAFDQIIDHTTKNITIETENHTIREHIDKALQSASNQPEETRLLIIDNLINYLTNISSDSDMEKNLCQQMFSAIHQLGKQYHISVSIEEEQNLTLEYTKDFVITALQEIYERKNLRQYKYFLDAKDYMEANYMDSNLSLSSTAEHLGISTTYLSKIFTSIAHIRFTQLLNEIRIEQAKELLSNPELLIRDISEKTGFLTIQNFMRVFKQQTGITPGSYRSTLKKENDS